MNLHEKLERTFGIKEDSTPKIGIWYYLWLKPHWKLWTMPLTEDKNWSHYEVWNAVLAEDVAKHHGLDDDQTERLKDVAYGMPRGRIDVKDLALGRPTGNFTIYHGDDFPSSLSKESELKKIIGRFDLTRLALENKVKIEVVDHEKMSESDKEQIQQIIGPITYQ
jgi:hypothetical protein